MEVLAKIAIIIVTVGGGLRKDGVNRCLSLTELPNDLLRRELLPSWHLLPSLGLHHQRFSL